MSISKWAKFKPVLYIGIICALILFLGKIFFDIIVNIFIITNLLLFVTGLYLLIRGPTLKRIIGAALMLILFLLPLFFGYHFSAHLDMPSLSVRGRIVNVDNVAIANKEIVVNFIRRMVPDDDQGKAEFRVITDKDGFFHFNIPTSSKYYGGWDMFDLEAKRYRTNARESILMQIQIPPDLSVYYLDVAKSNKWNVFTYDKSKGREELDTKDPFQVTSATLDINGQGDTLAISIIYDETKLARNRSE